MGELLSTDKELEKVVVVAVRTPDILESTVNEHLDELEFLAETAEIGRAHV